MARQPLELAAEGGLRQEVVTFLYDEGLRFGTLYPITEKSLAGRVKQVQPFIDHLARKRDQDKRKITS